MSDIVFAIIQLLGGLTFFLFGMNVMSEGLEKSTNGKLNKNITKVTKNPFLSIVFGAGLTIAVQSSSAVTVILVGLVNSGIMQFGQTIGLLMGSNIGTTFTTWLTSLSVIESENFFINMLNPENFSLVFAFIGILLIMIGKKQKQKDIGNILVGFAILMFGMSLMSDAMKPLSETEGFTSLLTAFENPLIAVVVGALFTGIIQSSAASIVILQTTSGLTFGMAIPIIMGLNIGTCVTAVISSIGVSRNAKKVAVVHLAFNIIGTLVFFIPYIIFTYFFPLEFLTKEIDAVGIAAVHSIFNVVTTIILLPFSKLLEALANKIIPEKGKKEKAGIVLDDRLLTVPTVAVKEAFNVAAGMCSLAKDTLYKSTALLNAFDEKKSAEILEAEQELDGLEDSLGSYMMKLSKIGVTEEDSQRVTRILHTISDFERIGDHAVSIVAVAKELDEKHSSFSAQANKEIAVLNAAVLEILDITTQAFCENDVQKAMLVEPLEQVVDDLVRNIKSNHILRLQNDECTISLGFALVDLLTSYRRVSDHCSNIAVAVLEAPHGTFETHKLLGETKHRKNENFESLFERYSQKYTLTK